MRITITLTDESGAELLTLQSIVPNNGTAIDKHLDNAVADAKNAVFKAGIASLGAHS